jgi:hypothetical protein
MSPVRPPRPSGLKPSFGFGDRLGLATLGHIDAVRAHGEAILPVFAQQSIREMSRTGRKPADVIADTIHGLTAANYSGIWSADADHLKTPEDVNNTAGAGFVQLTIDLNEFVDPQADSYAPQVLEQHYKELRDDVSWAEDYFGRTVSISEHVAIELDSATVKRVAVKFGKAIAHAVKLAAHTDRLMIKRGTPYEIELCLDETPHSTTLAEHFLIVEQCLRSNMKLAIVGPRCSGDFEPAIDFSGDRDSLIRSWHGHAAIARALGPYKLGLHNGSDKFSLYEDLAKITGGLFHVKTAGTSYLEALRVAARHERRLFRRIIEVARARFERDKATYRVSARLAQAPSAAAISDDAKLEDLYLDQPAGRQILHVTFGSILTDTTLGPSLRDVLVAHPATYRDVVGKHLSRHLEALGRGL